MRFLKKILSFVAGCVLIWKISAVGFVSAEEAPHDIKLTCETKYIDIDEIPEDRVIGLNMSIDNNPGFCVLSVAADIDPRLSYNRTNIGRPVSVNDDIMAINYTAYPNSKHLIRFDIFSDNEKAIVRNGTLLSFNIQLPESLQAGDFFKINIMDEIKIPDEIDTYFYTSLMIEQNGKFYGPDSFSELNVGGIHITGDQPVQITEIPFKSDQPNNEATSEENNAEHQSKEPESKPEVSSEIVITTPPVITSAQTTIETTTPPITSTSSAVTKRITEPVTTIITENINLDNEKEENKKEIDKTLLIVSVIIVVAIGGSLYIFIKRSKNNKHEK